jgi:hypothetical protein
VGLCRNAPSPVLINDDVAPDLGRWVATDAASICTTKRTGEGGVEEADLDSVTPHQYGHTFARMMIVAGVSAKALSRVDR